jgi:hypothetical protein
MDCANPKPHLLSNRLGDRFDTQYSTRTQNGTEVVVKVCPGIAVSRFLPSQLTTAQYQS